MLSKVGNGDTEDQKKRGKRWVFLTRRLLSNNQIRGTRPNPPLARRLHILCVILSIFSSSAKVESQILGSQPGDVTGDEAAAYHLACGLFGKSAKVYYDSSLSDSANLEEIAFTEFFSFAPESFFRTKGGIQAMGGEMIDGMGRYRINDRAKGGDGNYLFFTITSNWDCRLYRGDRPWPIPEMSGEN